MKILPLAVSLALTTSLASAEVARFDKAGIRFDVPPGWKATPDGEELAIETENESLLIIFWTPPDQSWDAAVDGFRDELDRMMNKVAVAGKPETSPLNGMPSVELEGQAEVDDAPVEWSATLLMGTRPVIALAFGPPGVWEQNLTRIEKLIQSIRKTK